jgi:hypothetical protein
MHVGPVECSLPRVVRLLVHLSIKDSCTAIHYCFFWANSGAYIKTLAGLQSLASAPLREFGSSPAQIRQIIHSDQQPRRNEDVLPHLPHEINNFLKICIYMYFIKRKQITMSQRYEVVAKEELNRTTLQRCDLNKQKPTTYSRFLGEAERSTVSPATSNTRD